MDIIKLILMVIWWFVLIIAVIIIITEIYEIRVESIQRDIKQDILNIEEEIKEIKNIKPIKNYMKEMKEKEYRKNIKMMEDITDKELERSWKQEWTTYFRWSSWPMWWDWNTYRICPLCWKKNVSVIRWRNQMCYCCERLI